MLSPADCRAFERDGFLIQRGAFMAEAMAAVSAVARADPEVSEARLESAKQIKLWGDLGDSVYAAVARQRGIVDPISQFLGGEVDHYHHKLIMKDADSVSAGVSTGTWEWHQDYGYWCKCTRNLTTACVPGMCLTYRL